MTATLLEAPSAHLFTEDNGPRPEPSKPLLALPPQQEQYVTKYRPKQLADVLGQSYVIRDLQQFVEAPYPCAFLFYGPTGTGKTSAAYALANELGIVTAEGQYGGLYEIASGEQTVDTIRALVRKMLVRPWYGSGWRMLIVNEADVMHPQAAVLWLDILEHLPDKTVIVFTTNEVSKFPARFRDRTECYEFNGLVVNIQHDLETLIAHVWQAEGMAGKPPALAQLPNSWRDGPLTSFRRVLQLLQQYIRKQRRVA